MKNMGLIFEGTKKSAVKSHRVLEYMGHQFVLVTITMSLFSAHSSHLLPRPYHWRLADGKNPPLDVSIDPESGLLREITFFIADKKIKQLPEPSYRSGNGNPAFQTNSWREDEYYLDEEGLVSVSLYNNDIYCSFSGLNIDFALDIDFKLGCLFNINNILAGFILRRLDHQEMKVLKDAGLI